MLEYLSTTGILVATIFITVYLYFKYYLCSYWEKHKVPHEAASFPLGNVPVSYFMGYLPIGECIFYHFLLKKSYAV